MAAARSDPLAATLIFLAFSVVTVALGVARPLARPSEDDQLLFELGYYVRGCLQLTFAADQAAVQHDIRTLSAMLHLDGPPTTPDGCPDPSWLTSLKDELPARRYRWIWVGAAVADHDGGRIWQRDKSAPIADQAIEPTFNALVPRRLRSALAAFRDGSIDATELHRRLYHAPTPLRHQIDPSAGRALFALGYRLVTCATSPTAGASAAIMPLADRLRIPEEMLPRDETRVTAEICGNVPASLRIRQHFGSWIGDFLRFGQLVAREERFWREYDLDQASELRPELIDAVERLHPDADSRDTAAFADGRLNAAGLYARLFGDDEPLLEGGR